MSSPEQPPREGALIRLARKARGLSVKEAAKLVPVRLGESRWYHIEGGTEGKGKPVVAPSETLAHMAHVVGLTPDRLTNVGREDAAEILREIIRQQPAPAEPAEPTARYNDPGLQAIWEITALDEEEREMAIAAVEMVRSRRGRPRQDQSYETRRHA